MISDSELMRTYGDAKATCLAKLKVETSDGVMHAHSVAHLAGLAAVFKDGGRRRQYALREAVNDFGKLNY